MIPTNTLFTTLLTPIGLLYVVGHDAGLTRVFFDQQKHAPDLGLEATEGDSMLLREAKAQLEAYFSGELTTFRLPLAPEGTPFRKLVWTRLVEVSFGETCSYGELARAAGSPKAARAVGGANAHNPIALVVPCHRVVGHGGALTGYAGGEDRKRWLLDHEGVSSPLFSRSLRS